MTHKRRDSLPIEYDASPRIDAENLTPIPNTAILSDTISLPRAQRKKKPGRNRSSSMTATANALKYPRKDRYDYDDEMKHMEPYMRHSHLQQYNKKEQEDLISIQRKLRKWIGSQHEYLILSQFIDLMEKIAPHIPTQQASDMFNQMDPSNNGQIATSLLLHDEFLPRMILNLFQIIEEDDNASAQSQSGSIVDDLNISDSDPDDSYQNMAVSDLISSIKRMKRETRQLKEWIVSDGQPAVEKVDEMQRMLDVYEAERTDKQSELQSFKKRLSTLDVIQAQLQQSERSSRVLLKEHVLLNEESAQQHEVERKKYNAALREAREYKRLNKELHQMNAQYNEKNDLLYAKLIALEEENQNLREGILQFETEQLQKMSEIDEYKKKLDEYEAKNTNYKRVRWGDTDQNDVDSFSADEEAFEASLDRSLSTKRRRRMTLINDDEAGAGDDTLDSEIQVLKARRRRNTIKTWYDAHQLQSRRTSYASLPATETSFRGMPSVEESHNNNNMNEELSHVMSDHSELYDDIDRQDSTQSYMSTMSAAPFAIAPTPGSRAAAAASNSNKLFEDAYAQEIKTELRKQIEKELGDDYALKLKQRDIQYQMELHKEKSIMQQEQREYREKYEKRMDEMNAKLTAAAAKANDIDFETDEMVYLKGDSINNEAQITDLSSDDDINIDLDLDEEKDVFDENMMMMDAYDANEPLLNKKEAVHVQVATAQTQLQRENQERKREKENARIERAVQDAACLSCFGLFTGRGTY